jgi:predicted ribosome quality control (RQC) complex YloA/Tae2 family protein
MPAAPSPKDRFTSLDTLAVVREVRAVGRARIDKAFDLTDGGWSLTLRSAAEGRRELVLVPGRFAALVAEGPNHGDELSPFARELRRLLSGAAVRSVRDPHGERYLEMSLARSDDPDETVVALEMFGSGNLTVARSEKILAVATTRRWAHRVVRVGAPYARPPERGDPWTATRSEIEAQLVRSRTDLASTLAARLSFGGPIAEELIARIGRAGNAPATHDPAVVAGELREAVAGLLAEVGDRPSGYRYVRGGAVVDATPYRSHRWDGVEGVDETVVPTFSEAAFEYFRSLVPAPVSEEELRRTRARRDLERQVEQQQEAIRALSGQVEELQAQAEAIFAHYSEAESALAAGAAGERAPTTIETRLGDRSVVLTTGRSPRESAQALYEESKRRAAKLAGARAALAETEAKLARPEPTVRTASRRAGTPGASAVPELWFERYRWFVSSDRVVVVAGRDARTNDLLVRRHLKDGDAYLHADLHGASSVIAKRPPAGGPIPELTLREAGQWAVAFSKAWRAGLASASAFWVHPDQVSKSAATGEFVPRGAWVIHGTKNALRDLPLELAVGTIRYDGSDRWTVAPPSAVRALGTVRFLLTPGEERDRGDREVELAKELGLSRTRLQSLLPAGGIAVRRP